VSPDGRLLAALMILGQEMLKHRGYIYTAKHEGWYSVSDETFYPPSAVQPTLEPATGRKIIVRTIAIGPSTSIVAEFLLRRP
jgi:hypothetical protein